MEIQLPSLFREKFCKNDTKPILGLKDDSSKRLIGMNPDKTEKSSQSDNFFFFLAFRFICSAIWGTLLQKQCSLFLMSLCAV